MNVEIGLTILGEAPSRTSTVPFDGRTGAALAAWFAWRTDELREHVRLENLLDEWPGAALGGDHFPTVEARAVAASWRPRTSVLLVAGRRLADAMLVQAEYLTWTTWRGVAAAVLPHPSGRNRLLNEPSVRRATASFCFDLRVQLFGAPT